MRALLQRVDRASVRVNDEIVGQIERGLLVFLACSKADHVGLVERMAERIGRYRVFPDSTGRSNLSVYDVKGSILLVPQFTLAADTKKGNRPSFDPAMPPKQAEELVGLVGDSLTEMEIPVQTGVFQAEMLVELVNHGPATYLLEVT
jgi:D-aminoacyl-tRNA deacylase